MQEDGATPAMSLLRGGEGEPATEDGTAAGLVRGVGHSAPWPPPPACQGLLPRPPPCPLYPTRRPTSILSPFSSLPTSHIFILKVLGPLYSSPGSCDLRAHLYPHGSSRRPGASWLPAAGAQRDLGELAGRDQAARDRGREAPLACRTLALTDLGPGGSRSVFHLMGIHHWRCLRLSPGRRGTEGRPGAEGGDSPHPASRLPY